jgi:hypothetical protein
MMLAGRAGFLTGPGDRCKRDEPEDGGMVCRHGEVRAELRTKPRVKPVGDADAPERRAGQAVGHMPDVRQSEPRRNTAIEMQRKLRLATLVLPLAVVAPMVWTSSASALPRNCSYANVTHGGVPYVAQVRTNLTSTAVGGASVCTVVSGIVRQVQLRGYDLGATPRLVDMDESWALEHHLVYPAGWPQPTGPIYDPHMHVRLLMLTRGRTQRAQLVPKGPSGTSPLWIELNEYT